MLIHHANPTIITPLLLFFSVFYNVHLKFIVIGEFWIGNMALIFKRTKLLYLHISLKTNLSLN